MLLPIDQNGVEYPREIAPHVAPLPIVFGRHRSSQIANLGWQRGPQYNRIEVAGVVCKVYALASVGLAIDPTHRVAAEETS